jgi:Methyltransferase domain
MSSASGAAEGLAADNGWPASQAAGRAPAAAAHAQAAPSREPRTGLFARSVRGYAREHAGEPVKLLQAGCAVFTNDLELDTLRAHSSGVSVRTIDEDHPVTRRVARMCASQGAPVPVLGDLRTSPLPPRDFGVIYCAQLLDRIHHAELVLDRLVAALKPGGLLLLRFRDRECAAGRLDRMLPEAARRAVWPWLRPQQAGPFPAVYEQLASAAGVQSYVLVRGLVIAERQAVRDRSRPSAWRPWAAELACRLIAWLSRGRLTDGHDDLLYVIRKPENRFARVL